MCSDPSPRTPHVSWLRVSSTLYLFAGTIGSSSGVVLASALHLKAKWDEPFDPRLSFEGKAKIVIKNIFIQNEKTWR